MSVIQIENITKDYGSKKGVFHVSFEVHSGETLGFLGPNGAGKTTTIRQLMGFIKPDEGKLSISGLDCFEKASIIQKKVGYLPGEIAFMDDMSGMEFIEFIAHLNGMKDLKRAHELVDYFELNCTGKIKKMSKGMKQKIGLVCAFMNDPEILILDEPTSGLDPLMQNKFIELIQAEKKKGKTILMSSHIFEEIEKTCDRAVIIRDGIIVAVEKMDELKKTRQKIYDIEFVNENEQATFMSKHPEATLHGTRVSLSLSGNPTTLIQELASYSLNDLSVRAKTLEEIFMHFYGENNHE